MLLGVSQLGYALDDQGSILGRGCEFFSSPQRPDRLWSPPSLLPNGYRCSFPGDKAAGLWSWPLVDI